MKKVNLLIIEDEAAIRDMIRFALPADEFCLSTANDAKQAEQCLWQSMPDIILLDWMLPGKNGIDFIRWIKQQDSLCQIPIIMLTARVEEENKVKGLNTGADDYITKPFSPNELVARIKTVLRRGLLHPTDASLTIGDITINPERHQISIQGSRLTVTPIEYKLLQFFMSHAQKTYTRDQLLTRVWGADIYLDERTVDVHIRRLRNRLKAFSLHEQIQTVRGVGYQFTGEDCYVKH